MRLLFRSLRFKLKKIKKKLFYFHSQAAVETSSIYRRIAIAQSVSCLPLCKSYHWVHPATQIDWRYNSTYNWKTIPQSANRIQLNCLSFINSAYSFRWDRPSNWWPKWRGCSFRRRNWTFKWVPFTRECRYIVAANLDRIAPNGPRNQWINVLHWRWVGFMICSEIGVCNAQKFNELENCYFEFVCACEWF